MGKGILTEQHLVPMTKLVSKMAPSQDFYFSPQFPVVNMDSDEVKWEVEYMSGGMAPFTAPGVQAPVVGGDGIGAKNAAGAMWKEKSYLDETLLNNLRQAGTYQTRETAERQIAKRTRKLVYRSDARKEWMCAKALTEGGFTYQDKGGLRVSVDYSIPALNKVTLSGNYVWGTGSTRAPQQDMFNAKQALAENFGVVPARCVMNTDTLKLLLWDANIATLLEKSRYGEGDLFKNPKRVLGELLGVGEITIYDNMFDVPAFLMGPVVGGSTTAIVVDDVTDFEVGGKLRFTDLTKENTWEDRVIGSIVRATNTINVTVAPSQSYLPGAARVTMKRRFMPDKKVVLYADSVNGEALGEFGQCPFGLARHYGRFLDTKDEWDPEGVWLRVQNKGLPMLWHPEGIHILTVG